MANVAHGIKRFLGHWAFPLDTAGQAFLQSMADIPQQTWPRGAYLAQRGQPLSTLVWIETGLVRSFYANDDHEINLRFLADASVATAFEALAQHWTQPNNPPRASEWLQCVTEVRGYALPIEPLLDRLQFPQLEPLRTELAARHYLSMEQRLRMLQSQKARRRYQIFSEVMPERIVQEMPNLHVASYLGLTPETLSRIKRQLRQD